MQIEVKEEDTDTLHRLRKGKTPVEDQDQSLSSFLKIKYKVKCFMIRNELKVRNIIVRTLRCKKKLNNALDKLILWKLVIWDREMLKSFSGHSVFTCENKLEGNWILMTSEAK